MNKIGFDNKKYLSMQSEKIQERINAFGDKLYLEFGGKLFDDYHAARVLPGFEPDSKIKMLLKLKSVAEILVVISANDIVKNKYRSDLGITYDADVIRLLDIFKSKGLYVGSVVMTMYQPQPAVDGFIKRLENLGMPVYKHYAIEGYPSDVHKIVSEDGYGKNEYVPTKRKLVVVTAPGPGSGKMATCLSQLYHENLRGVKAGYAKFETFPIWNIPLSHPVNIAYEAATADLNDMNMIDPYHLDNYGTLAVNYNRDVEIFPVVSAMLEKILGYSPYKSPTDMGVNMAGNCIVDDEVCKLASKNEIIRRYYAALCDAKKGRISKDVVGKLELLMQKSGISVEERKAIAPAMQKAELTGGPAVAIELNDGRIVTGKTGDLLGASAACLLNALKMLGDIDDEIELISPNIIEPLQRLKVRHMGSVNPRLHTDEVLMALSICAVTDPKAKKAVAQLDKLKNCEVHSSVMLGHADERTFKSLGMHLTCEPQRHVVITELS
ncbi:MAG: DUF1846 domain-containing protein [Clostridiales bacterium]|nr:DUF1846 domain-containing protein [Clostridiales bacterium]